MTWDLGVVDDVVHAQEAGATERGIVDRVGGGERVRARGIPRRADVTIAAKQAMSSGLSSCNEELTLFTRPLSYYVASKRSEFGTRA